MGLLLACSVAALAEVPAQWVMERDTALPAGRSDEGLTAMPYQVTAQRSRALARELASAHSPGRAGESSSVSGRAWRTQGRAEAHPGIALAVAAADAGYGTKLGVEWRPSKSTLGLEQGALGMQLESGYRLSLKVRRGSPSLYLRSQF